MRISVFLLVFAASCVHCKNHVKSLTESMGQEVIELGAPIKDLPPGLDEEPSAENDDEDTTSVTVQPATKRETRKTTTTPTTTMTKKKAESGKEDGLSQEEEESRIEKELSEIYKDTDYKSDTNKETLKEPVELKADKPIARARTNFKFQPDVNNKLDVERFRTSIDEISCDKRVTQRLNEVNQIVVLNDPATGTKLTYTVEDTTNSAGRLTITTIISLAFLSVYVCQ